MIKAVLFDLDGTLLPMEANTLLDADLSGMCVYLEPYGYSPVLLGKAFHNSIIAMIRNDGRRKNEDVFWQCFYDLFGDKVSEHKAIISHYYEQEFETIRTACGYDSRASACVREIRNMGFMTILATNPFFPLSMIKARLRWAGVDHNLFDHITTFDNSSFCKPNPAYYTEILEKLDLKAEECLMIGNDVTEDMVAETVGIKTFLLTDCIINREARDIEQWAHGSFPELMKYIREF